MKRMSFSLILLVSLMLGGCGTEEAMVETGAPKKANNPLAGQQEFLKQTRGLQSLVDQDAERKKKAMEEVKNN